MQIGGEMSQEGENYVPAVDGNDLVLTIDATIQGIAEKYLKEACIDNVCTDGGNIIIMNPKNGDILAMAGYPNYNLNAPYDAPTDELRTQLMPINRAYPLEKLMEAAKFYVNKTHRRITFEYGLIKNVNDTVECATKLADLLKGMNCHVNLIPVNYVPERGFDRTPIEHIEQFEKTLKKRGINATVRRELGSDIDAACGQLRAKEGAL